MGQKVVGGCRCTSTTDKITTPLYERITHSVSRN